MQFHTSSSSSSSSPHRHNCRRTYINIIHRHQLFSPRCHHHHELRAAISHNQHWITYTYVHNSCLSYPLFISGLLNASQSSAHVPNKTCGLRTVRMDKCMHAWTLYRSISLSSYTYLIDRRIEIKHAC